MTVLQSDIGRPRSGRRPTTSLAERERVAFDHARQGARSGAHEEAQQ